MNQKNALTTGIVLAFLFGVGCTFLLLQSVFVDSLQGSIVDTQNSSKETQTVGSCTVHEECPIGSLCKTGECVKAEKSYCSQPFMLAESAEGRFIRYTECSNRCVVSGETAFCQ